MSLLSNALSIHADRLLESAGEDLLVLRGGVEDAIKGVASKAEFVGSDMQESAGNAALSAGWLTRADAQKATFVGACLFGAGVCVPQSCARRASLAGGAS